jgi:hypothetical protein
MMRKIFFILTLAFYVIGGSTIYASGQMEAVTEDDNTAQLGLMVVVDRSFDVFHKITQSYQKGELDLSSWSDKDATRLNCCQLSKEDCCKLGIQKWDGMSQNYAAVDIINGTKRFISQLKTHLPNLKELIFRGEQWWCTVYSAERIECQDATIAQDVYFALKAAGYIVTLFNEGVDDKHIDRLLSRWSLTAEQYCGFIRMAWLLKATDDIVEFSPGADREYERGTGRLAERIIDGYYFSKSFMPKYEEKEVCLHRAIAAYSTLAKDNIGLSMILYTCIPACDVALERVMRFVYLAASKKTPTLLDTVVSVQEMRGF